MGGMETLTRPHGSLAYDLDGPAHGPLVVLSPGMGELRSSYRHLNPRLAAAGYRVATVDLRGHGDSSAGWPSYTGPDVADDLLALVDALGAPAVLVGNSFSADAAVVAAARAPEQVAGLVLIGPFVRDVPLSRSQRLGLAVMRTRLVGRRAWPAYVRMLHKTKPADLADHVQAVAASLRRPGRWGAVQGMLAAGHAESERLLGDARCPALVVMGTKDPDFRDPAAEATLIAERLGGEAEVVMVEGAGHYPQAERPEVVAEAVLGFLDIPPARTDG